MSENTFKQGDIVYHKANNLRMVVMSVEEEHVYAKYVGIDGRYDIISFVHFELSKAPIIDPGKAKNRITHKLGSDSTID